MGRKYRNKPVEIDGHRFDSRKEGQRYLELKALAAAGEITDLELHPRFELAPLKYRSGRKVTYTADFRYKDKGGEVVVEDVKGVQTEAFKLKWAIMKSMGIEVAIL